MRVSFLLRGLGSAALVILVSAQTPEQPLLRPVDDDDAYNNPEPEPAPPTSCGSYNTGSDDCAKNCPIWTDCGKLSVADTVYFLLGFGVCIVCTFYTLNNHCCALDEVEQQKRYEKLKADRAAREAQEAAEEAVANSRVGYQAAPSASYGSTPYGSTPYGSLQTAGPAGSYTTGGAGRAY